MTNNTKTTRPRRFARTPQANASPANSEQETPPSVQPADDEAAKPDSKIARVIALLKRPEGATLEEMISATGWLPHTTRAALTGLKKKGHTIVRTKRGGVTCYRITPEA